ELIVGGSSNDCGPQSWDRAIVQDGAERAGREDVRLDLDDRLRLRGCRRQFLHSPLDAAPVDVGDREASTLTVQELTQSVSDGTEPLHGDAAAFQAPPSELVANGGADAMEDSERRRRSRIAGAPGTGQARHMSGHASNDCHIFGTRADLLADNVPAPQAGDRLADCRQK